MKARLFTGIMLVLCLGSLISVSQTKESVPPPLTRILFVFDASQSMSGTWQSGIKLNIARDLLSRIIDSLKSVENLEMGLRVYGHQKPVPPQDCSDTRLEVPISENTSDKIENILKTLIPRGTTPIAYSLEQCERDFNPCDNCRNIVVLITDGEEECDGDPCAVSRALQKKGVLLKPFIIGIGRDFSADFGCVGTYFDASTERNFQTALKVVISQALNSTTAQVNLLDTRGSPTETNVNMTFYDNLSGFVKYNFIHTLNNKGLPDTLVIDPLVTYNIVVHTLPPVKADSVRLTPGLHTIIAIDAPQGSLKLKVGNNDMTIMDLNSIVRQDGKIETLYVQSFGTTRKYLTGLYDLEILCLPRMIVENVEINQSHTTTVEIPSPGIAVIQKSVYGYGSLYVEENNQLKWIYDLRENYLQESLMLQPGKYRIVFRSKYLNQSINTIEKSFKIDSGGSTNINLYSK
ncbi:MAG: VWA domain-containing protein [Bacteroidetes bacterium]|nr:VWA domain-containing protein [Bacteroidota bacterium]